MVIVIVICSGTLLNTPLQLISIQLNVPLLLLFIGLFMQLMLWHLMSKNKRAINISVPYLLILSFLPIMAAITANKVFGQSITSGIISGYLFYNYLAIVYFYFYFKYRSNALNEIKKIITYLGWFFLMLYYFIRVTMPNLSFTVPSYDGTTIYTFTAYSLSSPFIVWVGMIYLSKYKQTPKIKYLLIFFLFVSYPVVMQNARSFTVVLIITLLIFFSRELSKGKKLKFMLNAVVILIGVLTIAFSIPKVNDFFTTKIEIFNQALNATKGKEGADDSANARIFEVAVAMHYIPDNYLFGAGSLKPSTQSQYIREYFYADDIGLIGIIFNYGIIGLLIALYQLRHYFSSYVSTPVRSDPFLLGTAYVLLLHYLASIFTGGFVYQIGFTFLLLGILICGGNSLLKRPGKNNLNDSSNLNKL